MRLRPRHYMFIAVELNCKGDDELSWFNGKEMYCRIYQLEELAEALFNIIIAGNLFTVEEAENLWEISKNNNQDDDFETLHSEIERLISKRRAQNGNQ